MLCTRKNKLNSYLNYVGLFEIIFAQQHQVFLLVYIYIYNHKRLVSNVVASKEYWIRELI